MILPIKEQFLTALTKTEQLVPAPRTLGRALQLLRDPDSGLHAIADLIRADSALAVDILRCANSAYYSRKTRIADVSDAVQVIGFHETIRLVSLVAIHQTTNRNLGSYGIAAEDFWAESLFNGLFLEVLARQVDIGDAGEAYTSGLMRFVGRLAIDQTLHDMGGGLFWDGITPLTDWERENTGHTQAEVGGILLRKWQFPPNIILAIEVQDFITPKESWATKPLVQAVHFAAHVLPAGTDLASIDALAEARVSGPELHPFAVAHEFTPESVAELLRDAHQAFVSVRETLYH